MNWLISGKKDDWKVSAEDVVGIKLSRSDNPDSRNFLI